MAKQKKDHPKQVIDTDVPDGEFVDTDAWEAMRKAALEAEEADDA